MGAPSDKLLSVPGEQPARAGVEFIGANVLARLFVQYGMIRRYGSWARVAETANGPWAVREHALDLALDDAPGAAFEGKHPVAHADVP